MAIDSVGSKIMLHKATEFSREASTLQKRDEVLQAAAHKQAADQAQLRQQQVVTVEESAQAAIQRERERQRREARQGKREKEAPQEDRPQSANGEVAQEHKKIDIRI